MWNVTILHVKELHQLCDVILCVNTVIPSKYYTVFCQYFNRWPVSCALVQQVSSIVKPRVNSVIYVNVLIASDLNSNSNILFLSALSSSLVFTNPLLRASCVFFFCICWFHSLMLRDRYSQKQKDLTSFCNQPILQKAQGILLSSGHVLVGDFSLLLSGNEYILLVYFTCLTAIPNPSFPLLVDHLNSLQIFFGLHYV